MPLTAKGEEIKAALTKEYGASKGEQVLYAGKNKGTFSGIDCDKLERLADGVARISARFDAMMDADLTAEQLRRTKEALEHTKGLLAKEQKYQPHLQKPDYVASLQAHMSKLEKMIQG